MLLVERLRTPLDRLAVSQLIGSRGFSLPQVAKPSSHITPTAFHIGRASLPRLGQGTQGFADSFWEVAFWFQ